MLTSGHVRADSAASPGEVTIDERGSVRDIDEDDDEDNDDDDDDDEDNTDDDQHNNNGNGSNSNVEDACGYGINNNDNDDDDDEDGDSNLNNRHHHQRVGLLHRTDEEGSPTNKSARNRLQAHRDERCGLNGLRNIGNTCL